MDAVETAEKESLKDQVSHILEECRMVLPGIQALFGFQLIVVFSPGFSQKLNHAEQVVHFCALGFVTLSTALILAPAAYERVAEPGMRTTTFVRLATQMLTWSMLSLMFGVVLDLYVVARVILGEPGVSLFVAGFAFSIFVLLWFVLPFAVRHRNKKLSA